MSTSLQILYEDSHILVLNKPADLQTQGSGGAPGRPSLDRLIRDYLCPANPTQVYLGTVHRLDRPVSGVILWALTSKAAKRLAEQFATRETLKEYWALIGPGLHPTDGYWDDWLCEENTGVERVQVCREDTPRARHAVTRYRVEPLRLPGACQWVRLWPRTGRTHQLRVQAASRGVPILGDRPYGSRALFGPGIALHARSLTFRHPTLDRPMTLTAPVPAAWAAYGFPLIGIGE